MTPLEPARREPFFDYTDLFVSIGLTLGCIAVSVVLIRLVGNFARLSLPIQLLLLQGLLYLLAFGSVAALFRIRHDQPFWRSLGWRAIPLRTAAAALLAGPLLVLAIGLIGAALRTPQINTPFDRMLDSSLTIVLFGILAAVLGPISEELAFRGFLMPLLIRSIGVPAGIVATGILFGSLHGYEYQWSWQYMVLISFAGSIFGWAKYRTNSTITSALMHCTFNLTQFLALVWRSKYL